MRFAFKTANQYSTWADILAVWKEADGIELFESGWLFDHFYPINSPKQPEPDLTGPCLEGWTMLAALAQATTRLRLGLLVTGIHYRHPAVLAKMAATTDIISGGRLELGVGAGWNEQESGAYGIELGTMRERLDRFDEACDVIIGMLSREVTDYDGEYFKLSEARCDPRPLQAPHPPIVIGGVGEKRILPAVARHAQQWDASAAVVTGDFPRKLEVLRAQCREIGRDPDEITTSSHIWFDPAEHEIGHVVDESRRLEELGVDLAIVYLAPPISPTVLRPLAEALAPLR
jgi:F420-dependent oxidoreductase-like protein